MRCPYCSIKTGIDEVSASSDPIACPKCSRRFRIIYTDGNDHSPSEISEALPFLRSRMGELRVVAVREDQRFCAVCGEFYTKKDGICPNLIQAIKVWHSDPAPICNQGEGLTPEVVREEIEAFLKVKVKWAVLESIVNAKPI